MQNTKGISEDAREALARHFARLGSGVAQERPHRRSDPCRSAGAALRVGLLGPAQSVATRWRVASMARAGRPRLRQDANWCGNDPRAGHCANRTSTCARSADSGRCPRCHGRRRKRHSGYLATLGAAALRAVEAAFDLADGAIATLFSADEPERLRGPQHDAAWCDELASWHYP